VKYSRIIPCERKIAFTSFRMPELISGTLLKSYTARIGRYFAWSSIKLPWLMLHKPRRRFYLSVTLPVVKSMVFKNCKRPCTDQSATLSFPNCFVTTNIREESDYVSMKE
jgi:hypothetical protein